MKAGCLGWKSEGTDWLVSSDLLKTIEVRDIIQITLLYVQSDKIKKNFFRIPELAGSEGDHGVPSNREYREGSWCIMGASGLDAGGMFLP